MSEIKSYLFDDFARSGMRDYQLFFVFGPDRGLVAERAATLASASGTRLDDPFATIKLDARDIAETPGRLLDEMASLGLFGGDRLVWLRAAGTEKPLIEALKLLSSHRSSTSRLIVEAGDLRKGSGARAIADTAATIASIACYHDDDRSLVALVDDELRKTGHTIGRAAREALVAHLGGDRLASRGEIAKLALYAGQTPTIREEDVHAIIGDVGAISVDAAVDAMLAGDANALLAATERIIASKSPTSGLLQACLRQLQSLDRMIAMAADGRSPEDVMRMEDKSLNFRRKPLVAKLLRMRAGNGLTRELERLDGAIFDGRRQASVEDAIAVDALLEVTRSLLQRPSSSRQSSSS